MGICKYENQDSCCFRWVREIIAEESGQIIKNPKKTNRKYIPKKIKDDSWDKYIGKSTGEFYCYCCNTTKIYQKDFVAGHIISENDGGECIAQNIIPICQKCNLSAELMNMEDFISSHYPTNCSVFYQET